MLSDILQHSRASLSAGLDTAGTPLSQIDSLIVLDRSVDIITPLCVQLTYEGLVDELFGINSSESHRRSCREVGQLRLITFPELSKPAFVEVDSSVVGGAQQGAPPSAQTKTRKLPLGSADSLFAQLRDLNFAVVGSTLSKLARRIHDDYEDRHSAKTMSEVRAFVGRLGGLQAEHQALRLRGCRSCEAWSNFAH